MTTISPQLSPFTALAQLVRENPELPALRWNVDPDGYLMGDLRVDDDARTVMAGFVAVLGGEPTESQYRTGDAQRFMAWLPTTWRDVRLSVTVTCPVEALAPVGLPAAWAVAS